VGLPIYSSVSAPTISRFFALHYLFPFVIAGLVVAHLIALHEHGSSNPLGLTSNHDKIPFHPYYTYKDLTTVFLFFLAIGLFVFYSPNSLGHPDNYIEANPLSTPASIVPE
jgi:ubiquinol-cytochrome c reductase cytochrome b subunit